MRAQVTDQVGTPIEGFTFEDCRPFYGDDTAWIPVWQTGKNLDSLADQFIRVEIELDSARLYAVKGDYIKTLPRDIARHRQYGDIP